MRPFSFTPPPGGIGSAAIQLASVAGARVIATAGSEAKLDLCRSLGARSPSTTGTAISSRRCSQATDGRGVDVAFDSVGGEVTTKTFRCMAFNGRHLLVGFASGIEAEDEGIIPRPVLFGNFSLFGVCHAYVDDPAALKAMTGYNFPSHADGERVHARVLELVANGSVRPVVGSEVAFTDLPQALQAMADRQTVGRNVALVASEQELGQLPQNLEHVLFAVPVEAGELEELLRPFDHGTPFGTARHRHAPATPELEQALVAQEPEGTKHGVGVDPEHGGQVLGRRQAFTRARPLPPQWRAAALPRTWSWRARASERSTLTRNMMLCIVAS